MTRLKEVKTCNTCKTKHFIVPDNARVLDCRDSLDGYYWECVCKSTMFSPLTAVRQDKGLIESVSEALKKVAS